MTEFRPGDRVEWHDSGVPYRGTITNILDALSEAPAAVVDYDVTLLRKRMFGRTVVSLSRVTPISAVDRLGDLADE